MINLEPGKRYVFSVEKYYGPYSSSDWHDKKLVGEIAWRILGAGVVVVLLDIVNTYLEDTDIRVLLPSGVVGWIWLTSNNQRLGFEMTEVR